MFANKTMDFGDDAYTGSISISCSPPTTEPNTITSNIITSSRRQEWWSLTMYCCGRKRPEKKIKSKQYAHNVSHCIELIDSYSLLNSLSECKLQTIQRQIMHRCRFRLELWKCLTHESEI